MSEAPPKLFLATKAFVTHQGKVLVIREADSYADGSNEGRFDVIGGRLEAGEHFRDALLREVKEETGLDVEIGTPFFVNEWRPTVRGEAWQIVGVFFECVASSAEVTLSGDHDRYEWIDPAQYAAAGVIANLAPAFEAYLAR